MFKNNFNHCCFFFFHDNLRNPTLVVDTSGLTKRNSSYYLPDGLVDRLDVGSAEEDAADDSLLPHDYDCGAQFDNRVVGGDITALGEFPWCVQTKNEENWRAFKIKRD